ncbi:hypothetical protein SEA_CHRIDISON_46 [Arthrobacter phage Chridison]|nr:hypothetical protein SEA_CHRIDISON_46 [Arthrobacter phage Chridison]
MAELPEAHRLNCASLIPTRDGLDDEWTKTGNPCSCGLNPKVEEFVTPDGTSISIELAAEDGGLAGLFKFHGVKFTPETYAEANRMRSEALSYQQGEVRSVSVTGAEKGTKEARFDLIPTGALTEVAVHFGRGAQKYVPHNWRKGYEFSKGYAALQRHANAWWGGEDLDPEMQTSHLAAVAFHALALLELHGTHPEMDDRYKLTEGANGGQE